MHETINDPAPQAGTFERILDRLSAYLRRLERDHWLMFAAGLLLGLILS